MRAIGSSFVLILLLFLVGLPLSAQYSFAKKTKFVRGYIIYNSGDSVTGYVGKPERNSKISLISFKIGDIDQATVKISPIDAERFAFGHFSKVYYSEEIPMQDKRSLGFLKRIMEGPYPVYYYEFLSNQHILIKALDGKLYDLLYPPNYDVPVNFPAGENKFTHILNIVFSGNESLLAGIGTIRPDKNAVLEYLSKYYESNKIPYRIIGQPQFRIKAGIFAGAGIDWLTWKSMEGGKTSAATAAPSGGIYICFYDKVTGLGILVEDNLSYDRFHFSYTFGIPGVSTEYRETFLKTAVNNARLGFSWSKSSGSGITGFFETGGSFLTFINPGFDNYEASLDIDTKVINSSRNNNVVVSSKYAGGFLRTGINFRVGKNTLTASLGGSYLAGSKDERMTSVTVGINYTMKFK